VEAKVPARTRYERNVLDEDDLAALGIHLSPRPFVAQKRRPPRRLTHEEFFRAAGIRLEPGQLEGVRVAFDGHAPPVNSKLFDFTGPPPAAALDVLVMPAGVRSGKSLIFAATKSVYQALTCDVRGVADREEVLCSFIGPKQSKAQETLRYALGLIERCCPEYLVTKVPEGKAPQEFLFRSPRYGTLIRFAAFGADSAGTNVRGRWHVNAVVEEAAFFGGDGFVKNARDLYDAIRPRLWPRGGKMQVISSPWSQEGLLWDLVVENRGAPRTAVVLHGATDALRDDRTVLEHMARARAEYEKRGQLDLYDREWRAEFLTLGSVRWYDDATVSACGFADPSDIKPGDVIVAGADLGLVRDHAALVVARLRMEPLEVVDPDGSKVVRVVPRYAILHVDEVAPEPGKPLEPTPLCRRFAATMGRFGVTRVMADGYYRQALVEALKTSRINLAPAPKDGTEPHMRARLLMRDKRVDLLSDARLLHQLTLPKKRHAGPGKTTIDLPRTDVAGHCDVVAAFALALFQAYGVTVKAPEPVEGSPEWAAREAKKMKAEFLRSNRSQDSAWLHFKTSLGSTPRPRGNATPTLAPRSTAFATNRRTVKRAAVSLGLSIPESPPRAGAARASTTSRGRST
jgi:hypothetical protein